MQICQLCKKKGHNVVECANYCQLCEGEGHSAPKCPCNYVPCIVFGCRAKMILVAGQLEDGTKVKHLKCEIDACPGVQQIYDE